MQCFKYMALCIYGSALLAQVMHCRDTGDIRVGFITRPKQELLPLLVTDFFVENTQAQAPIESQHRSLPHRCHNHKKSIAIFHHTTAKY